MDSVNLNELVRAFPLIFKGEQPVLPSNDPLGWSQLYVRLCRAIEANLTDDDLRKLRVVQISDHGGLLRFYVHGIQNKNLLWSLVKKARIDSASTCQRCGEFGKPTNLPAVLCVECKQWIEDESMKLLNRCRNKS